MKLRFTVQVSLDIDPAKLTQNQRDVIANRMRGLAVVKTGKPKPGDPPPMLVANEATLEGLLLACMCDT